MLILGDYQKIIQETIEKYEEETNELIDKCFASALDEACNLDDNEESIKNGESRKKIDLKNDKNENDDKIEKIIQTGSENLGAPMQNRDEIGNPEKVIFSRRTLSPFLPASAEDLIDLVKILTEVYSDSIKYTDSDTDIQVKDPIIEREIERNDDLSDLSSLTCFLNKVRSSKSDIQKSSKDEDIQIDQSENRKKLKLLDLGCGDGRVMICLQKCFPNLFESTGIDISDHCISLAESILDRESTISREEIKFYKLDLLNFLGAEYSIKDTTTCEFLKELLEDNITEYGLENTSVIFMYIYPTLMRAIEQHLIHFIQCLKSIPNGEKMTDLHKRQNLDTTTLPEDLWDSGQNKNGNIKAFTHSKGDELHEDTAPNNDNYTWNKCSCSNTNNNNNSPITSTYNKCSQSQSSNRNSLSREICLITLKYHMDESMNQYFQFWDSPKSKFRVYICK